MSENGSPEQLAALLAAYEHSFDAAALFDVETQRMVAFNEAAHRALGYTREEFARLRVSDFNADHRVEEIRANVERMLRPEGAAFETRHRHRDGRIREVRVSGRPLSIGQRRYISVIWTDITDRKQAEESSRRAYRELNGIAAATRAIVFARDEAALLEGVCRSVVESGGYRMAWIGFAREDEARSVVPAAHAGVGDAYLRDLRVSWRAEDPYGRGPTGIAIRERRPAAARFIRTDPAFAPWRARAEQHGYASSCALPLLAGNDRAGGALMLYAAAPDAFDDDELRRLAELADTLSFGIRATRDRSTVRQLSAVVEQSPNSVVITDLDARILYVNEAFTRNTGYTREEALGRNPRILKSGRTPAATYGAMWATLLDGRPWRGEFFNRRKDGLPQIENAVIVPLRGEDGRPSHYVAVKEDVTERKSAEEQLRKLFLAVEQSPESIVISDLDARIEYVNEAFTRHSGYSREEVIGQNPRVLQSHKTPPEIYREMWDTLTRGKSWKGQFVNRRKDGTEYVELAIITPIRQPDGRVTHYLAIKDDVTEKKRMGEELDRYRHHLEDLVRVRTAELAAARERAEAANVAKSAFLANMSHEIRTPMNAILGLAHLMRSAELPPEQYVRLQKIDTAAKHLLAILNDILDLSKVEAGKLSLERADFDLLAAVREAFEPVETLAEGKGLEARIEVAPDLPARVSGDPLRLGQVLGNLCGNAVKFTERGSVTLRVRAWSVREDGWDVRFEVEDTGIGMSEDDCDRVFLPFEQADTSTTRRYGGTGLGLAISRRLVEAMGGQIGVESRLGAGSTFWFTLPLGRPALAASGSPALASVPGGTRDPRTVHVLLVEDDLTNQEVAAEVLTGAGYLVDIADHGVMALEMAAKTAYDLVLMDMRMPLMDGLEATRLLRARPEYATRPIVALTANVFGEDRDASKAAGMDDFVSKPVEAEALLATVARWTGAGQSTPAPLATPVADPGIASRVAAVPGLDVAKGLQAVQGHWPRYERLLRTFLRDRVGETANLRRCIASHDLEGALQVAAALKGVAGTIGARAVAHAAARLDATLREGRAEPPALESLLATLEDACGELVAGLYAALPREEAVAPPAAAQADRARALEVMTELEQLLMGDDVRAARLFTDNLLLLRAVLGEPADGIARELDAFDFEAALRRLRAARPPAAA